MKSNPKTNAVTSEFLEALGLVLEEFETCSLQPRLQHFREAGKYKMAGRLEKAFARVSEWHRCETALRAAKEK